MEMRLISFMWKILMLAGVSSAEICPPVTKTSNHAELAKAWVCQYDNWRSSLLNWKELVESQCSVDDFRWKWEDAFSCSHFLAVECVNPEQSLCSTDAVGCTTCRCLDGKFKNWQDLFTIWKEGVMTHQKILKLYDADVKNCVSRIPDSDKSPTASPPDQTSGATSTPSDGATTTTMEVQTTTGHVETTTATPIDCTGENLTASTTPKDLFSHPSHGTTAYNHFQNCRWVITAEPGKRVNFTFVDFELEDKVFWVSCVDYVQFHDGPKRSSPSLGKYCGSTKPATILSTSEHLHVYFNTDDSGAYEGFHAKYSSIPAMITHAYHVMTSATTQRQATSGVNVTTTSGRTTTPSADCTGGNLTATSTRKDLFSHGSHGSTDYNHYQDCYWLITAESGMRVNFTFVDFELQDKVFWVSCVDYVEFYDGLDVDAPNLGHYCGSIIPSSIFSTARHLYVYFKTDSFSASDGFHAEYSSIESETTLTQAVTTATAASAPGDCTGGNLTASSTPEDLFSHPSHGSIAYNHQQDCHWVITAAPGMRVNFTFVDFELQGTSWFTCVDYVQLYDGPDVSSPNLGRYCGDRTPVSILSTSEHLYVHFKTDMFDVFTGFHAEYSSIKSPL